jgi:hypothetical protein
MVRPIRLFRKVWDKEKEMTTFGDQVYQFGGAPVNGHFTTGNIYFVDDSGSDGAGTGTKKLPFATLDFAIGQCTANQGDIIYLMPGHAETADTQVICDVAGIKIVGIGHGADIPTITANASAADCFSVTAASVYIENIKILGAASCTALINLAAADFTALGCVLEQVATPVTAVTVASGGSRFNFLNCLFMGKEDGPDYGIDIEAKLGGPSRVLNCTFNYSPGGLDAAGIRCNAFAVVGLEVNNCVFLGMEVAAIDINSSDTDGGDGIIANCSVSAKGSVGDIDTLIDAGGCGLLQNYGTDIAAEGGGLIPVTTPA